MPFDSDDDRRANPADRSESFTDQLARVRDTTRNLIESVMLDTWPRNAAVIDFGLDSPQHYEALYYPIREGEIDPKMLDDALGHGQKLTDLTRAAESNPHKDVRFHTSWDGVYGRPGPENVMPEEARPGGMPGRPAEPQPEPGRGPENILPESLRMPTPADLKELLADMREEEAFRRDGQPGLDAHRGVEAEHRPDARDAIVRSDPLEIARQRAKETSKEPGKGKDGPEIG